MLSDEQKRERNRKYAKRYRDRKKAERETVAGIAAPGGGSGVGLIPDAPATSDPARALAEWSRQVLKIPYGHREAGKPLQLPDYGIAWLRDALAPGVREAGCFVARKNAKSAIVAALILAYLSPSGPLRRRGWRAGIASVSREKAAELWQQASDMADISNLEGLTFGRVPRIIRSEFGTADFLSADKSAGHASGFDLAVCDELGLFPERGRDLVAGLLSSTSARDGRLLAISIYGHSPLTIEMVNRRDDPATVVHEYAAPEDCPLDDVAAWYAANPALGGVKSMDYMRDMARRAAASPEEQANFRSFDLNQHGQVSREMIVTVADWQACAKLEAGGRSGPCFVGFDLGGSVSLTACCMFWPATGRIETYLAAGDIPDPAARGEADGEGNLYTRMIERGEMRTYPGRVTPVVDFLAWMVEVLDGYPVEAAGADRYRKAEAEDALTRAQADWPIHWRASGTGADGADDVRQFQKAVAGRKVRPEDSLALKAAISNAQVRRDGNGNPALDKVRKGGRIDAGSAAILAVGIGARATYSRPTGGARIIPVDPRQSDLEAVA